MYRKGLFICYFANRVNPLILIQESIVNELINDQAQLTNVNLINNNLQANNKKRTVWRIGRHVIWEQPNQ